MHLRTTLAPPCCRQDLTVSRPTPKPRARTPRGTYHFPARYLREQPSGYWVQGAYMRLQENRRARLSLELESTFRMLKIKRLCEGG